jgi:SAM-dependent methyltransferase
MTDDYRHMLTQAVLDEDTFVQMTCKGSIGPGMPWRLVRVRPVLIRGTRHWQFSHFDARQDHTRNYTEADVSARLNEVLALPFSSIQLETTLETINVQITRKGKAILHRSTPQRVHSADLRHDAPKYLPLPDGQPDAYLQKTGIMTAEGRVKADMRDKFYQINEFLKMLDHTGVLEGFGHTPVRILDCGCGSAYLSFAAYHYLNDIRGIPASLSGVDTNAGLVEKSNAYSRDLGLNDACFYAAPIIDFVPEAAPDILLALHACDTATDEALALGIRQQSPVILSVPCCHKHLHRQLESRAPFDPVMRHGILKQRLGDILTDSFRALILRIMGYKTDVVEFISSEHTSRNLMIRAVRRASSGADPFVDEYRALKAYWNVTPYLETLLGESFASLLSLP